MQRDLFKPAIENLSRRGRRRRFLAQRERNAVNTILMPGGGPGSAGGYGVADTNRQPSASIWGDCPWNEMREDGSRGPTFFDDFDGNSFVGTQTTEIVEGQYKLYNTGTTKINQTSTFNSVETQGGILVMPIDTDGDQCAIGTQSCPFLLDTVAGGKLWFEARVATLNIATNDGQLFVGLGENAQVTFGAATPLANANAVSSGDAKIGFNRLEDGLGVINTSYADRASAWTDVGTAATSVAALTWIKLGMIFDRKNTTRCVRFFANGVELSSAMTKAALLALTNMDAKGLGPVAAVFGDSVATATLYIDWWRVAQLYP